VEISTATVSLFCIKAILFISDFGCLFPFGTYLQIVMTIWDAVLAKNNF
jgi:hypothetical protein